MINVFETIRIIFGSAFVLFLPGFAWSFVFFRKEKIDLIERIVLSFGLSIILVPMTVFWMNYLVGIRINILDVSIEIAILIFIAIVVYKKKNNLDNSNAIKMIISHRTIMTLVLIVVIGLFIFLNKGYVIDTQNKMMENRTVVANLSLDKDYQLQESKINQIVSTVQITKIHTPINLSKDDILISFRIDDITFVRGQKPVLENALLLARKYNITFDLAVIAKNFDERADPDTYQIFLDNQDVFEIVSHGLTHVNPINKSSTGEFYDEPNNKHIPPEIQEDHIRKMRDIFVAHNLTNYGAKIFLLPWSSGDQTTIDLAEKYGYKLITQRFIPVKGSEYNNGYIIVSKNYVSIDMNQTVKSSDILKYKTDIHRILKNNQTRIQIIFHSINFYKMENSDDLINQIIDEYSHKYQIKFGMISDGLK